MKTINYLHIYPHLNLIEFDQFLDDLVLHNHLTLGQAWYILDRLIDLCRLEPITNYDLKTLLTNLRLEHTRQQPMYLKLIDSLEFLAESYSKSLSELHSFERDLQKFISSNTIKRIPEEIRKRLNEIANLCRKFRADRRIIDQLFRETIHRKFYYQIKEILKTKNLINRKQSFIAIVQIHKYFTQFNVRNCLSDQQLDLIVQNIQINCLKEGKLMEEGIKNMIKLGWLQEKTFIEYLTKHFLSNDSSEKCLEIRTKLQAWPLTIDFNHPTIRSVVKHLIQLENQDHIDTGTTIEIQNRLNQLARFGKHSSPQVMFLREKLLQSQGKKFPSDITGFQSIQSYRLILDDLVHAIELECYIQKLAFEHRISDELNYQYRDFLYQILQNEIPIDALTRYRSQLRHVYHIRHFDIEEMKRFISSLPKRFSQSFVLTLTDKLLDQLKWNGKPIENSMRDQLLKCERSGVLSHDNFEEIYNHLSRTSDLNLLASENNQLFNDLFEKINDLLHDDLIELNQSIEIKQQLYLLEEIFNKTTSSEIITIESRLLNASNPREFQRVSQELKTYLSREQFRLSRAEDLISKWHLNQDKGTFNEKQILKLFDELANLNRLYHVSTIAVVNRYIAMKQILHRPLIKDLQRLKIHAINNQQAIECLRSIEARLYQIDHKKRFDEILIKNLENHLSQIFDSQSRPTYRIEICKQFNELIQTYVKSNSDEYSSEQLFVSLDSCITQLKQGPKRPSKIRYHNSSSDAHIPIISPSLQSLQISHSNDKITELILFMEEKSTIIFQDQNDYQLSFLYNILNRAVPARSQKNEIVLPNNFPPKSVSFSILPTKIRPKKFVKRRHVEESMNKKLKPFSPTAKKTNSNVYVFDQHNSFCPARVPIKYGFQIRSLIENRRLPSWRFSEEDKNQIIYKPSIDQDLPEQANVPFKFPSSTSPIPQPPLSIDTQVQHRWIHLLLNSSLSKEQNRQLSSVVHQYSPFPSTPITTASPKTSPKKDSDKLKVKRRPRCTTFEEHLLQHYLPRWCLIYSQNFLSPSSNQRLK